MKNQHDKFLNKQIVLNLETKRPTFIPQNIALITNIFIAGRMGSSLRQSADCYKVLSQGCVQAGACQQAAFEEAFQGIEYILQLSAVLFMQKDRNLEIFVV